MAEGILSMQKNDQLFLSDSEGKTKIEPDTPLEIFLAGKWITGIFHPVYNDFWDLLEYRLQCPDGSYCGLLFGMQARTEQKKRRHKRQLSKRSYLFPVAEKTINEGEGATLLTGWAVPLLYDRSEKLYGVVRYFPDGDSAAWIESDTFFPDGSAAEVWIRQQFVELHQEGY